MSGTPFGRSIRVITALLLALALSGVTLLPAPALAATYQLSGKVTDQSGNPIPGTTVAVIDPSTSTTVASATTDSTGNYALSVDGGTYNIQVTPPTSSGFQPAQILSKAITGDTTVNVVLVPSGSVTLSGRVLDRSGQGIPGQVVQLNPPGGSAVYTTTDATGFYSLQVAPGNYYLNVQGPNTSPTPNLPTSYFINTVNPISLSQSLSLDLPLPFKRVDVHVQDSGGVPGLERGTRGSYWRLLYDGDDSRHFPGWWANSLWPHQQCHCHIRHRRRDVLAIPDQPLLSVLYLHRQTPIRKSIRDNFSFRNRCHIGHDTSDHTRDSDYAQWAGTR